MSSPQGALELQRVSPDERCLRMDRAAVDHLERFGAAVGGLTEPERRELDGLRRRVAWLERRMGGGQ